MLIAFTLENYRSFRERQTFSMVANTGKEHIDANTTDSGIDDLGRLLRSSAIYGPNAAGKTNLLRAMQFMQNLVVHSAAFPPTAKPPHDPFKLMAATRDAPTDFEVAFIQDRTRYEYGFSLGPARIEREWLVAHPKGRGRRLFDRFWNEKQGKYNWDFSRHFEGRRSVWSDVTRDNALFLSTAIQLNNQQLKPVFEWFQKRLVVVVGNVSMNATLTLKLFDQSDGKTRLLRFLREADPGIADVEIRKEPIPEGSGIVFGASNPIIEQATPTSLPQLVRVSLSHSSHDFGDGVGFDISEESNGTQALFRTAGAWLNVLANGEVLVFDEINTSLHPLLVRFLIEQFHSRETNPLNAQLIFSTHDTTLLSQELFRRDQIWFVEKHHEVPSSRLFPLTEFRPRNDEAIERSYLRGRYGALPLFDPVDF